MTLLRDHHGKPSTVRVACLACTLTACAAVLLPLLGYGQQPDFSTLAVLLGGGQGAKIWQSGIEHGRGAGPSVGAPPPRTGEGGH